MFKNFVANILLFLRAFWQHKIDMKDFLRAKCLKFRVKLSKFRVSLTFSHRFVHYFVEFCRDRRLLTFLKVGQKICNIH